MNTNKYWNFSLVKAFGDIRILTREEELNIFRTKQIYLLRAFFDIGDRCPKELIDEYRVNFRRAEEKNLWVHGQILDEMVREDIRIKFLDIYNRLIRHNIRLIISIAKKKYLNKGTSFLDLINEGIIGLIITISKFNYLFNCKFSTYCIHWIKQRMYRCVNENFRTIKLPMHAISAIYKIQSILESKDKGEELDDKTNRFIRRVSFLPKKRIDLEHSIVNSEQDSPSLEDSLVDLNIEDDYDYFIREKNQRQISMILGDLLPIEERLIRMRYGLSKKGIIALSDISRHLRIDQNKIRRIENARIRKIKNKWKKLISPDWRF